MTYKEFISKGNYNKYAICTCVDYLTRICHSITCDSCPLYISKLMPKDCKIKNWSLTDDRIKIQHIIEEMFKFSYMDKVADILGVSIGDCIDVGGNSYKVTKDGLINTSNGELNKSMLSDILAGTIKIKGDNQHESFQ